MNTLAERGLDIAAAAMVFGGVTLEFEDTRKDYGKNRITCFARLAGESLWSDAQSEAGQVTFQHEERQ